MRYCEVLVACARVCWPLSGFYPRCGHPGQVRLRKSFDKSSGGNLFDRENIQEVNSSYSSAWALSNELIFSFWCHLFMLVYFPYAKLPKFLVCCDENFNFMILFLEFKCACIVPENFGKGLFFAIQQV